LWKSVKICNVQIGSICSCCCVLHG